VKAAQHLQHLVSHVKDTAQLLDLERFSNALTAVATAGLPQVVEMISPFLQCVPVITQVQSDVWLQVLQATVDATQSTALQQMLQLGHAQGLGVDHLSQLLQLAVSRHAFAAIPVLNAHPAAQQLPTSVMQDVLQQLLAEYPLVGAKTKAVQEAHAKAVAVAVEAVLGLAKGCVDKDAWDAMVQLAFDHGVWD